jgi:multicomponent Na+:H+ antiporter subunit G
MSEAAIGVLLVLAVIIELASALGVLLMPTALDRLHFLGPATIIPPLAVAAAVWLKHGVDQSSIKATLVLVFVVVTGPVLSHVTARAVVARSERR